MLCFFSGLFLLFFFGPGCTDVVNPEEELAKEDYEALKALFNANGRKVISTYSYYEVNNDKRIVSLDLPNERLNVIPKEIGGMVYLEELNLGKNSIDALPQAFEKLVRLEVLYLDSNLLTSLPDGFKNIKLRTVDLTSNKLEKLPLVINVTYLNTPKLSHNQLSDLPPDFKFLSRLEHLELDNNHISKIAPEFGELKSLEYLDISNNQLSQLPLSMLETDILYLNVGGNQLCPPFEYDDSENSEKIISWLNKYDIDWKQSQNCDD